MRRPLRATLLQLPVQSHDYAYSRENLPLATGLVAAWARRAHPDAEIELLEACLSDDGSDAAIVESLATRRPDVLGLGCSVWNLERSLWIARAVKRRRPNTLVVLGGPEIAVDNDFLRCQKGFDVAVVGEGERTFSELLDTHRAGAGFERIPGLVLPRPWRFTGPRSPIEPLDEIPSPFLTGVLGPSASVCLESVRGCPQRCAYCHYHKSFPRLRAFELLRIEQELVYCLERGVSELTFVDPCFARRPALSGLLGLLSRVGHGRLEVRCELNAEDVTERLARSLARAGVREVEVGLQTTNPRALRLAQRPFQRHRFLEGVRRLRGVGIRVLLDVMVGLPGDRLEDVQRTVELAVEGDLFDDLKVYPLCVIPGTLFRSRAAALGLVFQREPPYHVLRTQTMSAQEIHSALAFAEEIAGVDLFPVEIPGERGALVIRPGEPVPRLASTELGQALRIDLLDPRWPHRLAELERALAPQLAKSPFTLLSWLLPGKPLPSPELVRELERLAPRAPHPIDRDWFATHSPHRSVQVFLDFDEALVRLPSDVLATPVAREQRACWICFKRKLSRRLEDRFVDELEACLDDPTLWFRIGARP